VDPVSSTPPAVSFEECDLCRRLDRQEFAFLGREDVVPDEEDLGAYRFPRLPASEELLRFDWAGSTIRKCPRCGTYYQYQSLERGFPDGSRQNYLYRVTPTKARLQLRYAKPGTEAGAEREWLEAHYDALVAALERLLRSPQERARELAAEALVDHHKVRGDWAAVKGLLLDGDPVVRLGALHSFEPAAWVTIDVADDPVLPTMLALLRDAEEEVANAAMALLRSWEWGGRVRAKKLLPRLRKTPAESRSKQERLLLVQWSDRWQEQVDGLEDPDADVRRQALSGLCEHADAHRDEVALIKDEIRRRPEASRTPEMADFVADPQPWRRCHDDDDD
jgi:hypothetical protein